MTSSLVALLVALGLLGSWETGTTSGWVTLVGVTGSAVLAAVLSTRAGDDSGTAEPVTGRHQ